MAGIWLWLGSSNTKAYKAAFEAVEKRHFTLCTKAEHFMNEIESLNCDYLTISGLDNILADLTREKLDPTKLMSEMDGFFQTLDNRRVEGLKIVVEPLIPWKKHSSEVKRAGLDTIKTMKIKYPGILFAPRPPSLRFAPDGVHLVDRSSSIMFKVVKELCEDYFFRANEDDAVSDHEPKPEDMETQQTEEGDNRKSKKRKQSTPKQTRNEEMEYASDEDDRKHSYDHPTFQSLVKELRILKREVHMNRDIDLLVHAGTKEEIDKLENNQNMNKVVVSGLDIPNIWADGTEWKTRIDMIKTNISDLFHFIDPTNKYDLGYVKHLNQKLKGPRQIVEVTLDSEKQGRGIRKALAGKIKTWKYTKFPECMNGVSISPALTISTRVRVAILKAIAKVIGRQSDNHEAWVIQHAARPVMKVELKKENGEKMENSFGFAQSIAYMMKEMPEAKLSKQDLFDAYSIAGKRFGPEISHYFVLMDWETAEQMSNSRNKTGRKRDKKQ